LFKALKIVTLEPENIASYSSLDQLKLRDIIISEFTKSYHNKHVDSDNDEGNFKIYKRLNLRIAEMVEAIDANYKYPKSLACQMIEGALHQHFMRNHFKTLTEHKNDYDVYCFLKNILISVLKIKTISK
jgi:hypothetical protein